MSLSLKHMLPPSKLRRAFDASVENVTHSECPGCGKATQSVTRSNGRTWHITCYRDPAKVAAYRAQRRKDASV